MRKFYFRVVEMNNAYDFMFGENKGWIYCSNSFYDYYEAIKYAIAWQKKLPWTRTWVELIID